MIIPEGFAQVNWVLGGSGAPTGAEVTCGISVAGTSLTIAEVAEACYDAFVTHIRPEMTNKVGIDHVLVKYGPTETGPSATFGTPQVGPANIEVAAPNTAFLITKHTDFGGRAGKGRLYLPGVPEQAISSTGAIDALTVTALTTAWNDLDAELTAAELFPYLLHGAGSPLTSPSPITSWTCESLAATQRRRMRR